MSPRQLRAGAVLCGLAAGLAGVLGLALNLATLSALGLAAGVATVALLRAAAGQPADPDDRPGDRPSAGPG